MIGTGRVGTGGGGGGTVGEGFAGVGIVDGEALGLEVVGRGAE